MRIAEIAATTGVEVETVRYYEKTGLLPSPKRMPNGYRAYSAEHVERLAFIRHCRSLDVSLADIQLLLALIDNPKSDCHGADALIDTQLERVRARIESLTALERQLGKLRARCKSPRSARQCGILAELVHAAHSEACACHEDDRESDRPIPRRSTRPEV